MTIVRSIRIALFLSFLCLLQACGGGGSTEDTAVQASGIDGVAQKGPLMQGSTVLVGLLNAKTWQPSGSTYVFSISNNLGNFNSSSTVFSSQFAESTATGYYLNELTGKPSGDTITVRGLSDLVNDRAINLNVLTTMVRSRMRALMTRPTNKLGFGAARAQAQKELLDTFYIYNSGSLFRGGTSEPASFNEADLAKGRAADQVLAAISAVMMAIGQDGNGTTLWLSRFEADLADDGLINNSPGYSSSPVDLVQRAQREIDLRAVAATLNGFYGFSGRTEDALSQWNDSSGGQDKVIDRYKFAASGVEPGTAAVSPAYSAGSDDVGQCVFASDGVLYRNGAPVAGTVKAASADAFAVSLVAPVQPGTSSSVFISRVPPSSTGACPSVAGSAGQVRLVKFSVTTKSASVLSLAAGVGHSLAVRADGTLWAWGRNDYGQLGDGTTTSRHTPVQVGTDFVSISAKNVTTMGLKTDGTLWIWGTNELYSIPDPSVPASLVPLLLDSSVTAFALSSHHGAYIRTDGTMKAWGHNVYGQNGTGDTNNAPYRIEGPSGFAGATITCGWDFNVSTRPDGSVWTWGFNHVGQIGDGTYNSRLSPFQVGTGYKAGIAGYGHTVAVRTDGTLWFWGAMYTIGVSSAVPTQLGTGFNGKLAGGNDYLLAAKDDGTVWAAGPNDFGQLGTGNLSPSAQMQKVLLP